MYLTLCTEALIGEDASCLEKRVTSLLRWDFGSSVFRFCATLLKTLNFDLLQKVHFSIYPSLSYLSVPAPRSMMSPPPLMLADVSLTSKHLVSLTLVFPLLGDAHCNRQSFRNSSVTNQ